MVSELIELSEKHLGRTQLLIQIDVQETVSRTSQFFLFTLPDPMLPDCPPEFSALKASNSRCRCRIARIINVFIIEIMIKGKMPSKNKVIIPAILAY